MTRRIFALVLSLVLLTAGLCGCSEQKCRYEELSFTLPADYVDLSQAAYAEDYDFLYDNGTVAIAGTRETRQALSAYFGQLDAEQYARLVIKLNGLSCTPTQINGLWCFSYDAVSNGTSMTYICAIYEAQESLWQVQAYCTAADFAAQQEAMWELITSMDAA